jgi:hypothetical protein
MYFATLGVNGLGRKERNPKQAEPGCDAQRTRVHKSLAEP